jgi:hypothetical protein
MVTNRDSDYDCNRDSDYDHNRDSTCDHNRDSDDNANYCCHTGVSALHSTVLHDTAQHSDGLTPPQPPAVLATLWSSSLARVARALRS